ncbi:MAG: hypothetical protein GY815_07300, partial [Gammaproteobacteria bacterium]|nr:hypothetical protein [Gammaproteobacteria bacterium]
IYDESGNLLTENDDNEMTYGQEGSIDTLDSFLTYTFESTGIYYVKVSKFSDSVVPQGSTYVLQVSLENSEPEPDNDNDGIPDIWEDEYGLDKTNAEDALHDNDEDGLNNLQEYLNGTSPLLSDTDSDGLSDLWEVTYGLDNNFDDSLQDDDLDGLNNLQEYLNGTSPLLSDTDSDGLSDLWEVTYGLDNNFDDSLQDDDLDGLTNIQEFELNSDPTQIDSDGDSIIDSEDSAINDDSIGENSPPVIEQLDELTIEAQAQLTGYELTVPNVTDNNRVAPSISLSNSGPYALGRYELIWTALDAAGNQST